MGYAQGSIKKSILASGFGMAGLGLGFGVILGMAIASNDAHLWWLAAVLGVVVLFNTITFLRWTQKLP
jgi:hypothetical protein